VVHRTMLERSLQKKSPSRKLGNYVEITSGFDQELTN
jgi:hypothetical protein